MMAGMDDLTIRTVDLNVRWERRVFRLRTTRIVKSNRKTQDILERWAERWCRQQGHVLQPGLEFVDLSHRPEYYASGDLMLGVAWRYIEGGRAHLGDRQIVVQPGIHVLRLPIMEPLTAR